MKREYPIQTLTDDIARSLTREDFGQAAKSALAFFDELNRDMIDEHAITLDCREGCSLCCWLRVDVFAHEVLLIAHHIERAFTDEQRAELFTRLDLHAKAVLPLSPFEHATMNIQCPLLVDGRCSVYAVRPHSCRRHHSQDFDACKFVFDHPTDLEAPAAHDRVLFRTLTDAMQQNINAYAEMGFDHTIYELGTALYEALDDASSWSRWHLHQRTFHQASETPAA